ncbi:MAG: acyl-CoA reductase [Lachnospiraceae bacterium]
MQKSEDVVIHMNENNIKYLVGNGEVTKRPLPIYSEIVLEFLDALSKTLRNYSDAKAYPDVLTFSFWCRKSNVLRLKEEYICKYRRFGRGIAFHIAPSNVPINFAFSLVFGLLSGNSNIVRVSEKDYKQVEIVCNAINSLLAKEEYGSLKNYIVVVSYGHDKEINDYFSSICAVRVVWGGDDTINEIRKSPILPRTVEIAFADRYSFAVFDEKEIEKLTSDELSKLAEKFYNDTYLMDQNACSAPHMIFWIPSAERKGRKFFWNSVHEVSKKYDLPAKKVIDKYTLICEMAAGGIDCKVMVYDNLLYVAQLDCKLEKIEDLRGKYGLFFECNLTSMDEIFSKLTEKTQTCVIYGIEPQTVINSISEVGCTGIDRIVNPGEAMDIGVYWDGYDIIGNMSRMIMFS